MPRKTTRPSKKTAPKKQTKNLKTVRTNADVKTARMDRDIEVSETKSRRRFPRISKRWIVGTVALILLGVLLYNFRSLFIVATVNGQPIDRVSFIRELEKQAGSQALNTVVTKALILQEAKKNNVTVTDAEIDTEIKKVEDDVKAQGQTLDEALSMQGMTREDFREQLRFQKMIEKMVGKDIKITDEDVNKYIEENQESLPETTEATQEAELKTSVKEQLRQQQLSEKVQTWLEDLRKNSKINYFVNF